MSSSTDDPLLEALLSELAAEPDGMSLPRLCKRLGVRMSVLMRTLAWIGEDSIAGVPGAGFVRLTSERGRDVAMLTDKGRQRIAPA